MLPLYVKTSTEVAHTIEYLLDDDRKESFYSLYCDCSIIFEEIEEQRRLGYEAQLSDAERAKIWRAMHLAVKKMNICMRKADEEAKLIYEINTRQLTRSIIEGTIGGLYSASVYGAILTGCLTGLAHVGGDMYEHFLNARDFVIRAKFYGDHADALQERLWKDE